MPKYSSNRKTTKQVLKLDLKSLIKSGFIKSGYIIQGIMNYNDKCKIGIESNLSSNMPYIKLDYSIIDNRTGQQQEFSYKIELSRQKSNLGKGYFYYFLCPFTGKKAKILYMAYDSKYFKCFSAYNKRIYYESQKCSKRYYPFVRRNEIEKKLTELENKAVKSHYQGKETRINLRINYLEKEFEKHHNQLEIELNKCYQRLFSYH